MMRKCSMGGPRRTHYADEVVALVCHELTVGMQKAHELMRLQGNDYVITGPFADLHPDLYDAAIEGVRRVRRLGSSLSARDHHNDWVEFLKDRGWQYGPVKDVGRKIHPNLVEWYELAPEEQDKDRVFISVVVSLSLAEAA